MNKLDATHDPLQANIVLGVGAHPDDLDFMASGTLSKLAAAGAEVYYLIITDGSKGSSDRSASPAELIDLRQHEQRQAAKILGVKDVFFLGYEDGLLEVTMQLKKDISKHIRTLKPDVVFAMDPSMLYDAKRNFINHPDHRAGGQAVLDAVFPLARDHLSFPELYEDGIEPHNVKTICLTNFASQNFYVDIADTFELKLEALAAHASQVQDFDMAKARIRQLAEDAGRQASVAYDKDIALAEGFLRINIRA